MAIISKINLFDQPEQHVLSIRTTIHFNDFPDFSGQVYRKIEEYAAQTGLLFSDSPFVCFYNTDLENLDVEIGFPVANSAPGNGKIAGHTFPAQKVVSGIFLGAYQDTDPLMFSILQWVTDHGYKQQGPIFNYYLNDDDRPVGELLTRIAVPIY